jgi:hypothetical protein
MAGETETSTGGDLPETVDVAGAVALMDGLADDGAERESAGEQAAGENAQEESADTAEQAEGDAAAGEEGEQQEGEAEQETAEADGAPEFWSAEDKAAWQKIPAELRPLVKKYEQQRVQFVNEKAREAAAVREHVQMEVKQLTDTVDQAARWWAQAGPALQQAFASKWEKTNWAELAEKDPAQYAKLRTEADTEAALLAEAHRRGQADIQAAQQRAEQAFQQARQAEHAKVATRLPEYFGTPEKAAKTYDELARFLFAKGIPADRIHQIHEAPIIELALAAMRFEQAQRALALRSSETSTALAGKTGQAANTTARATPTRVQPGPASRTGNRNADAARQVGERFRRGGGQSIEDAAELIRLNGL